MYYPIWDRDRKVGDAQVSRMGLYYNIHCRLNKTMNGLQRINICSGDRLIDIGICVPINGVLGIDTTIPTRQTGEEELIFRLAGEMYDLIPVSTAEPVMCLSEYKKFRYISVNGMVGITMELRSIN